MFAAVTSSPWTSEHVCVIALRIAACGSCSVQPEFEGIVRATLPGDVSDFVFAWRVGDQPRAARGFDRDQARSWQVVADVGPGWSCSAELLGLHKLRVCAFWV